MTYRIIAVQINESRHADARIALAARMAMKYDAHLVGVAAAALPEAFYMPAIGAEGGAMLSAYLDTAKQRAEAMLARFDAITARAGVSSFEHQLIEDEAGDALCLQARYSDLLIVGQDDPQETLPGQRPDMLEYVLMHCARPVLILPYAGRFDAIGSRVVIAWDGGLEATRAVTGSLPLLQEAKIVQVVVFNPKTGLTAHGEQPGADIGLYLARHGVNVEVSQQSTNKHVDTGNALLSYLGDVGADLLVMGAYGHSRFREILLGGVTRTILRSMIVPVLMAH